MKFSKVIYFIIILFASIACTPQLQLEGRYENRYEIPLIEQPIFKLRGLNTLVYQFNIEIKSDSTYLVYNCLCNSSGQVLIKNDSLFLINQTQKTEKDSIETCFDEYAYKIKQNGKKLIRRDKNTIERLYKLRTKH